MTEKIETAEKKLADVKEFYLPEEVKVIDGKAQYRDYELSPMSDFYIYGKGDPAVFNGGFRRVKEDIRELAYGERKEVVEEGKAKKVKGKGKTNTGSVFTLIFALLAVAVVAVSQFVDTGLLGYYGDYTIVGGLISFFGRLSEGLDLLASLHAIGLMIDLLFVALTLVVSLFSIKGKFPLIGKIFSLLAVAGAIVMIADLIMGEHELMYGAIALAAMTVFMAISALCAKRKV